MRKLLVLIPLTLAACGLIIGGSALAAANKTITVKMNGKQETPKGSPTGSGTAKVTLEPFLPERRIAAE